MEPDTKQSPETEPDYRVLYARKLPGQDAIAASIGGITRIEMDKETKRTKEILRRLNNLERRIDKDWRMQNAINEKATEAMATLLDMYAKYGHSTSESVQ